MNLWDRATEMSSTKAVQLGSDRLEHYCFAYRLQAFVFQPIASFLTD
jgi:hypothetical protein